tara:strand:+ start:458 stop:664 length:207 start_codon:yes stop_codon:yes gene_type:complete
MPHQQQELVVVVVELIIIIPHPKLEQVVMAAVVAVEDFKAELLEQLELLTLVVEAVAEDQEVEQAVQA